MHEKMSEETLLSVYTKKFDFILDRLNINNCHMVQRTNQSPVKDNTAKLGRELTLICTHNFMVVCVSALNIHTGIPIIQWPTSKRHRICLPLNVPVIWK
jgi:hypothetical protein